MTNPVTEQTQRHIHTVIKVYAAGLGITPDRFADLQVIAVDIHQGSAAKTLLPFEILIGLIQMETGVIRPRIPLP